MSVYDAFVFGVCVGFIMVFPIGIGLHFVARFLSHDENKETYP